MQGIAHARTSGLQALTQGGIISPFTRARRLFESVAPGHAKPIELTVGDPREAMPAFVTAKLAEGTDLGSYPEDPRLRRTA